MEIILRPEDILDSKYLKQYNQEIEVIHKQLVGAKNNLIILQRIEDFPFYLITGEKKSSFWQFIFNALFESTIMALSRILDESGGSRYQRVTLPKLRDKILKNYLKSSLPQLLVDELHKRLDEADLDQQMNDLSVRFKEVRNNFYAHLDFDYHVNVTKIKTPPTVSLNNLDEMIGAANLLFQVLGLNVYHQLELWDYGNYKIGQIDVDEILDDVVKRSYWIDKDNEWRLEKEDRYEEFMKQTEKNRTIINQYRIKFRLEPL